MNKKKFTEFFKGKGYYVLLFVGVLAVAAVAIIGSQLSSNNKSEDNNYVDLNDTEDNNVAAGDASDSNQLAESNPVTEDIANNGSSTTSDVAANDNDAEPANGDQVEYDDYGAGDTGTAQTPDQTDQAKAPDKSSDTTKSEDSDTTAQSSEDTVETNTDAAQNLSFSMDDSLTWPVEGDVLMDYSMDHTTYFATLQEYKVNPALILGADVGAEVKAAADGVVTSIDATNPETGYTITMAIGDGYNVVYGQLNKDSVTLKVGDSVKEGKVIATVAEPTKYYTVEGSNLYFEVLDDNEAINPMLLLR